MDFLLAEGKRLQGPSACLRTVFQVVALSWKLKAPKLELDLLK